MGWFSSENYVTNNVDLPTTEIRIIVGAVVVTVILLVAYILLRLYNKYQKKSMEGVIQQEIRLNNVRVDQTKWYTNQGATNQ